MERALFCGGRKRHVLTRSLVVTLCVTLAFGPLLPVTPAQAEPGQILNNSGQILFDQAFFAFEVESPLESLKSTPIWDELEQMLDNPYLFLAAPNLAPNTQGFPSYRASIQRRRSFLPPGCSYDPTSGLPPCNDALLEPHVVHPLNYNHMTGEELRLLNPGFAGRPWTVPDRLVQCNSAEGQTVPGCAGTVTVNRPPELGGPITTPPFSAERVVWIYRPIDVSPGADRVEAGEAAIDHNSPIRPDVERCIVSTEIITIEQVNLGEGLTVCGGDPGEPGYVGPTAGEGSGNGFGFLRAPGAARTPQYSVPAVPLEIGGGQAAPGGDVAAAQRGPGTVLSSARRLFDPERGLIQPRNAAGVGGLRKPSLRVPPVGTPANPGYTVNSVANLADDPAALEPSNENDYYRGAARADKQTARRAAETLGKALFWDMQVGSDTVQSCGSCHFHAGADNRTKNQLNPNHLGGDFNLELFANRAVPPADPQSNNQDVVASDFPFHKVANRDIPGERAADGDGIVDSNPGNVVSHANDVMSSMGVRFRQFVDIPIPGTGAFGPPDALGVSTLLPDIGNDQLGGPAQDPIPLFQGLRRVEPRNTPALFATAMNFDNFWDGRARHDFNGGSVFGPSDPQAHVFVASGLGLVATRQIIRFASIASLATGPALSDFEMSFAGRNWAKIGKKLLQGVPVLGVTAPGALLVGTATPLANQLVSTTDSVLGIYSNQGGSGCGGLPAVDRVAGAGPTAPGKPGLCISYPGLIRRAFYPALWQNGTTHLDGSPVAPEPIPVLLDTNADGNGDTLGEVATDPFDGYVLTIANGPAAATDTNQFSQMEANMALFFGLSVHAWVTMLLPDNTPFDQFMDANPDSFASFGEANEPGLALDLLRCDQTGGAQPCFIEVGNFKRDPNVVARINCNLAENCPVPPAQLVPSGGTRQAGQADALLGLDMFLGSNLSLKNPNFRSFRCGECHAQGTLTDHTVDISHQTSFGDFIQEFLNGQPGIEAFPEPLGRNRVITGFALEGELQENAQDAIERNIANFCTVEPCVDSFGNAIPGGAVGGFPQAQAFFDNGVYNIGVTPIANDIARGGNDPFGWPLSLAVLALKNLGGVGYTPGGHLAANGFADPPAPGIPLLTFDPESGPGCAGQDPNYLASHVECNTGGLFEPTAQDQQINPGFGEEPANPMVPPYLAPWASNLVVGDETAQDEMFVGVNTLMFEPMLEGFIDVFGPFNPAATVGETFNSSNQRQMATWPVVNKVNRMGSFKAPPLRQVELTGPYFHNGGKLTLRQQVDFYMRGGDFPKTNSAHRDFLIMNLNIEDEAVGGLDPVTGQPQFTEAEKEERRVALVDFLLELTDQRVKFEQAPFDHPEIFVPLDGTAPDNTFSRPGFLANLAGVCAGGTGPCFRQVPEVGAAGNATPLPNFLGISSGPRLVGPAADCGPAANNHYCH